MTQKITDYLGVQRICSLTTLLPDGAPHAAILHYSFTPSPLRLYFSTDKTSIKCKGLSGTPSRASVAIGFSEAEWFTLQLDGTIVIVSEPDKLQPIKSAHYLKFPNSKQYEDHPTTIFLEFTPTWWRYTDFNTQPSTILSSDQPPA